MVVLDLCAAKARDEIPGKLTRRRPHLLSCPPAPTSRETFQRSSASGRRNGCTVILGHIRVIGTTLSPNKRMYIRKKLGGKFGKFAGSIERISVRVKDVNGPRGGIDQVCQIKVVLRNLPSVVFESRDASLDAAIAAALAGAERAVRRKSQRRRMKKLRGRAAGSRDRFS